MSLLPIGIHKVTEFSKMYLNSAHDSSVTLPPSLVFQSATAIVDRSLSWSPSLYTETFSSLTMFLYYALGLMLKRSLTLNWGPVLVRHQVIVYWKKTRSNTLSPIVGSWTCCFRDLSNKLLYTSWSEWELSRFPYESTSRLKSLQITASKVLLIFVIRYGEFLLDKTLWTGAL